MLSKGLNFALPPASLEYSEYLVNYELFFRYVLSLETSHLDRELLKSRLKYLAFSSFKTYNSSRKPNNLTPEEFESLLDLSKNKDVVIQKSDKGNSVVSIDKIIYTNGIKKLLDNFRQFEKLSSDPNKELIFILNCEQKVIDILKEIKNNQINEDLYNKLFPVGSQPRVFYGFAKAHKKVFDGCPAFRPILSAIGTPTYKIAKFLVPMLKDLTSNEYSVKGSFDFAKEMLQENSDCFMASLDIISLFTNIALNEAIYICLNESFDKKHFKS